MEVLKMNVEKNGIPSESKTPSESLRLHFTDPMLYDRLHTLSVEYSLSVELLVNVAVKRLINDVDFVRKLRMGKVKEG